MIVNRGLAFAKKLLRPTPGKLIIFGIVVFLMFMLPTYPVKVVNLYSNYTGSGTSNVYYSNEPLALVIMLDYEWVEGISGWYGPITEVHYTADPGYLTAYYPFFILAYAFSCYFMERIKWPRYSKKMAGLKPI